MIVQRLTRFCDGLNTWTGRSVAWLIWVVVGLCVFEVVTRRVFNLPHKWSYDVINMFYSVHFMLLGGYTLLHKGHVSVDLFSTRLSQRIQAILQILTYLVFFFPFLAVLFWVGLKSAHSSWLMQERTSIGLPLVFPIIKSTIPAAAALLFTQGIAEFVRAVLSLGKGGEA